MALSLTEATALAGFGINEALLKGQGVGAKTIKALGKAAVKLSPYAAPVARGTVRTGAALARRNPVAAAALGGYGLYRAGALDPVEEAIQMEVDRRIMDPLRNVRDIPENIQRATETPVFRPAVKRKVSKYSKAIKAGMAAVKASKFNGKKGKISNAKTTFAKVNKVASAVNKGKKVSAKGVTGVIKRAVGRFL
jgi:hypothetical protein